MAFLLFLIMNATLFIRPGDALPALAGVPIYLALAVLCSVVALPQLQKQFSSRTLQRDSITLCVLGLLPAILLSHVAHAYLGGALSSSVAFVKVAVYYLLLISLVNTPRRMRLFLMNVAACSSVMILLCVLDFNGMIDLPAVKHVAEGWGETATGDAARIMRMNGIGIFSDPNDLSLLIVATGLISLYFFNDRRLSGARVLWLGPLFLMGLAFIHTGSRGGLLAAAAAGFIWFLLRYGVPRACALAAMGLCCIPVVLGRQGSIDLEEGTGQHRIQLWSDGLQAIQSPNIAFGIGADMYPDLAGYVAHNSFVHAYVELGFFGGTLFLGCFLFSGLGLWQVHRQFRNARHTASPQFQAAQNIHPELVRLHPYLMAMLAGWAVGLLTLSRCYVAPTYMVIGVAACYLRLVGWQLPAISPVLRFSPKNVRYLVGTSAGFLFCCMLFVRIFAHWG